MNDVKVSVFVAADFSMTPGPRNRSEGEFSGEQFLDEILRPRYKEAREKGLRLFVDLDGAEGYATSFLEAAFGGLSREFPANEILACLDLKSDEEPYLLDEINEYIKDARA